MKKDICNCRCLLWRCHPDLNWGVELLQSSALPLGYGTMRSAGRSKIGASDEARTRYLHLGKVALYQMSYTRIWCLRSESNQRHADFQSAALPAELRRHVEQNSHSTRMRRDIKMATRNGLEPSTSSVTGWRANRLHHRARQWWEQQGSNL